MPFGEALTSIGGDEATMMGEVTNQDDRIDHDRVSLIVWLRFNIDCEEYDRRLPGIERYGEWIPVNDGRIDGATLSRQFARLRRTDALNELIRLEIPREIWSPAMAYVNRLSHDGCVELLKSLQSRRGNND